MQFSVIIPTRNRPDLLRQCLQAIAQQRHADFEVIVIDDGSDTATRAAHAQIWTELDERFRLVECGQAGQRGQGPSASRNLGMQLARGEYLAFCDDDDLWTDPDRLSTLADLFASHPAIELAMANQRAVSSDGRVTEDWLPELSRAVARRGTLHGSFGAVSVADVCSSGGFAHLNMLCISRKLVESVGGFWEAVNYEEDRDFFWRCVDASKGMAYSPDTVAQHHVPDPARRTNVSTRQSQSERWLVASMVSRHIAANVTHRAIVRLCLRHEGSLLRRLALDCQADGRRTAAVGLAWQALAGRFSLKWALYCLAHSVRR